MRIYFLLLGAFILLAGCGSSGTEDTFAPAGAVASDRGPKIGQIFLNGPRPGRVDLVRNGQTFYSTTAGPDGIFRYPAALPESFDTVATTDDNLKVVRRVRLPVAQPMVVLNAVHAIATHYQAQHPNLSLEDAERRVHLSLEIPVSATSDHLTSLESSPFSHTRYLQLAAQNGGFDQYARTLAGQVDTGIGPIRTAAFPLTPLAKSAADGAIGFAVDAITGGLLGNICASPFTLVENQVLGWLAGKLGFESSTEKELNGLASQLTEIQTEIAELERGLTVAQATAQLNQDQAALNVYLVNASAATTGEINTATAAAPSFSQSSNLGPQVPSTATNLVTLLSGSNLATSIEQVCGYLLGQNSPYGASAGNDDEILTYNNYFSDVFLATTPGADLAKYSWRSDHTTQRLKINLVYYLNLLNLIANQDSELAHAITLPQTATGYAPPSTAFNQAVRDLLTIGYTIKLAATQVPQPIQYTVLADTDGRTLYYPYTTGSSPAAVQQTLMDVLANLHVGPFTFSGIPSTAQVQSIYNRASQLSPADPSGKFAELLGGQVATPLALSDNSQVFDWAATPGQNLQDSSRYQSVYLLPVRSIPDSSDGDSPYIQLFNYGLYTGGLTVSQNGNQMQASVGGTDVTKLVAWKSSDTSIVDVSSVDAPKGWTVPISSGQLFFHQAGSATVTAEVLQGTSKITGSATVSSSSGPQLTSILVNPQNIRYPSLPQPLGTSGAGQQFYLTGLLSDNTAVDLTTNTQASFQLWNLLSPSPVNPTTVNTTGLTQVPSSQATFNPSNPGFLSINAGPGGQSPFTNANLLVVASFGAFQQGSQLQMPTATPAASPTPTPTPAASPTASPAAALPTIFQIVPAAGSVNGIGRMRVTGTNFVNVQSVTIGGTPVGSFTVTTPNELELFNIPPGPAGPAPLVVKTSSGSAQATFTYIN